MEKLTGADLFFNFNTHINALVSALIPGVSGRARPTVSMKLAVDGRV